MAHHGSGSGYPWDAYDPDTSSRPHMGHRISSISYMSSGGESRGSVVSLPSPTSEGFRSNSTDEIDISHVRLSPAADSDVVSPIERHGRMAAMLPETLRVGRIFYAVFFIRKNWVKAIFYKKERLIAGWETWFYTRGGDRYEFTWISYANGVFEAENCVWHRGS
jgi:hypothetical protein